MRKLSALFLGATALAGPGFISTVAAQEGANAVVDDHAYFRIGGGVSWVSDWDEVVAPGVATCLAIGCNPERQLIALSEGYTASAAIGFDYADGIRTELEYRFSSSAIESRSLFESGSEVDTTIDNDIAAHFVMSNFYFDLHNSSRLTPYLGGGVGGAFANSDIDDRDAALAWQARGGVSLAMGGGFSADLEYNYIQSNPLFDDPDDITPSTAVATREGSRYKSSSVLLSVRKAF
ncbi:MAG: outer membrane beta-barrel protein [Marinicaulis sp.]|nr:outer membrane beta-barrel protein [Marinicaulis sp.]